MTYISYVHGWMDGLIDWLIWTLVSSIVLFLFLLPESIWNAASFYQESSYLYFPTLQAELASDISFYFKTSSPSGVFLENQGLKDFIRVELSCEWILTPQWEWCSTSWDISLHARVSTCKEWPQKPSVVYFALPGEYLGNWTVNYSTRIRTSLSGLHSMM